jgi:hypothetical protein
MGKLLVINLTLMVIFIKISYWNVDHISGKILHLISYIKANFYFLSIQLLMYLMHILD